MKKLGFGLMRLPVRGKIPTWINGRAVEKMVDRFIERGFTYFDTAYVYHGLRSEAVVKRAVVKRYPRDAFTIATKLPLMPIFIHSKQDQEKIFNKQLKKCGVDFFDYYLIHNIGAHNLELANKMDTFDFVLKKKAEGKIKNVGFSFHDTAELLDKLLTEHPEMDFVQLQINYLDWDSVGIQSKKCYEVATKHGKPVIVMEPVKGGTLAKVPKEAEELFQKANPNASVPSWAIRYAASLDNVMVVLSGMSNQEQVEDNTAYMENFVPLTDEERATVAKVLTIITGTITVPCTGCGYCTAGCPKNLSIPNYFALLNEEKRSGGKGFSAQGVYYNNLIKRHGKASDCIGCKQCEKACPQHLQITEYLKEVAKTFGK